MSKRGRDGSLYQLSIKPTYRHLFHNAAKITFIPKCNFVTIFIPSATSTASDTNERLIGGVVGGVVGGLLVAILIISILICCCYCCYCKGKKVDENIALDKTD